MNANDLYSEVAGNRFLLRKTAGTLGMEGTTALTTRPKEVAEFIIANSQNVSVEQIKEIEGYFAEYGEDFGKIAGIFEPKKKKGTRKTRKAKAAPVEEVQPEEDKAEEPKVDKKDSSNGESTKAKLSRRAARASGNTDLAFRIEGITKEVKAVNAKTDSLISAHGDLKSELAEVKAGLLYIIRMLSEDEITDLRYLVDESEDSQGDSGEE